ncbi:hypothetical protein [Chitinophaga nivalis]|uniref:Alpha-L-rhamnosidase six-hairpin glycosidase domain-containing protein n=1 Tax=Chitinophaga nivalis TaxID=2991709 RepID=A0ABT3IPE5_9BACT|nr:hypothetical protein [Chitinophaga nivalis]MCW3464491.1 hypothetical protein [Chitinophaga nivalis]MCW3485818.1 hypothetical protein [Chitinophaga nivalis]
MKRKGICLLILLCICRGVMAQVPRWTLAKDGGISWVVKEGDIHTDQIEMSGKQISAIVTYGTGEKGNLVLKQQLVFPLLRTIPNNTHASLTAKFDGSETPLVTVNGVQMQEIPQDFYLKGYIRVHSRTNTPLTVTDILFPTIDKAAYIREREFVNSSTQTCKVKIDSLTTSIHTDPAKGVAGAYNITVAGSIHGEYHIPPGGSLKWAIIYTAGKARVPPYYYASSYEWARRNAFVDGLMQDLVLETPNDTINRGFAFAKIRAVESIYDTKAGLMHGPGGGAYYAAIWANDQAEYANPFFPFLGNLNGNESAANSFRLFAKYMNPDYRPIPSSVIAEGDGYWNGAGDRGDQAMIAYGASRFALASGDVNTARQVYPLVQWCLQYLERKKMANGIITSDADELEGRFPAGKANLSTNTLAYGAYESAAALATSLGQPDTAAIYRTRAQELAAAIEQYFGHVVQGYDTYRYYEGNTVLRSWICLPLTMGLLQRKAATIQALLSPHLWSKDGILTAAGDHTFWDRSTLYAFKGLFFAGATDTALTYLAYYTRQRLLGEHVPYAVEAWPEGNQRHLSAESALYCRIMTEGLFGIVPAGLRAFRMCPRLPAVWNHMGLRHVRAFGADMDIRVERRKKQYHITVTNKRQLILSTAWNGKDVVKVELP